MYVTQVRPLGESLKNYGPSCGLRLARIVLQNCEKLCIVLFWDITQYSLVETLSSFGTLVATYQSALRHSPLDNVMNTHNCKELKLCITDQQLNSVFKIMLPITPTLHHHIITTTTTSTPTTSATAMNASHIDSIRNGCIITICIWYCSCYIITFLQEKSYSPFYVSVFITYFILVGFNK